MLIQYLALLAREKHSDAQTWNAIVRPTYEKSIQTHPTIFKLPIRDLGRSPQTLPEHYLVYHLKSPLSDYPSCLLSILDYAMTLDLGKEALQLIEMILTPLPPANSPFWVHFKRIIRFIEQLVAILAHHRMDAVNTKASPFITEVLEKVKGSTFHRCPIEPTNWRRIARSSCGCNPCGLLNQFLSDPNQAIGRFAYSKKIRDHLQSNLPHVDYRFETEKVRSPHTLVIRKTNNEYTRLLREWTSDVNSLYSQLRQFRQLYGAEMKGLFGKNYDSLLHEDLAIDGLLPGQRPLQVASASMQNYRAPPQVAGMKRKVENVVDLTGDASD